MKGFKYTVVCLILFSCSKEIYKEPTTNIVGKWKLKETYDNYKSGSFQWNAVSDSVNVTMEFNNKKEYILTHNNYTPYTGTYNIDHTKKVTVTKPDGTIDYQFQITDQTDPNIIVDFNTNGGVYRQKLLKIN
jgi:hypothetical protein